MLHLTRNTQIGDVKTSKLTTGFQSTKK